jgi:hypothetical protein
MPFDSDPLSETRCDGYIDADKLLLTLEVVPARSDGGEITVVAHAFCRLQTRDGYTTLIS